MKFKFDPCDFWVGFYYDKRKYILYICPIPMCVIIIKNRYGALELSLLEVIINHLPRPIRVWYSNKFFYRWIKQGTFKNKEIDWLRYMEFTR